MGAGPGAVVAGLSPDKLGAVGPAGLVSVAAAAKAGALEAEGVAHGPDGSVLTARQIQIYMNQKRVCREESIKTDTPSFTGSGPFVEAFL